MKPDALKARGYDAAFKVTPAYRAALPDVMQNEAPAPRTAVPIQQVGMHGFRLPLRIQTGRGVAAGVEAVVTGTVSIGADVKGINMSRIVRAFYDFEGRVFTPETLRAILARYRRVLGCRDARLRVAFSCPLEQRSLRSIHSGWQYYQCAFSGTMHEGGAFRKFIEFDFIYSSACPCSAELAEHARDARGVYGIPHSQRSKARLFVEIAPGRRLTVADLHRHCLAALLTETQVIVRREDEQAFAEMNGAHIKFVEDAVRLVHAELVEDPRIADFQIACSHLESLHAHDAVAVICKGVPGGFDASFADFGSLVC